MYVFGLDSQVVTGRFGFPPAYQRLYPANGMRVGFSRFLLRHVFTGLFKYGFGLIHVQPVNGRYFAQKIQETCYFMIEYGNVA